ncbi:The spindle assembly checkpoint protein mad2 [Venustampulla echinocandica]|uniref:The spindle assembly checkpoint protein mad2 n=1 Tax=Venustampulla echinocandica TaxID=2656787 RepID=A0A370T9T8_9HELO|nr:The spindle assembly checkpoint protein mad2 [Venustampulla echinocandica]RDL30401.1 The spindle assembly checkpoint protein mad2 [Venustampulla echinocandica]
MASSASASASAPPPPTPILNTALSLHRTLTDFLTVAIHTILYTRSLYPQTTFLTSRAYNLPVHQNRHPAVCAWINSAVTSLTPLLSSNAAKRVVIVIYSPQLEVLERYIFDISRFPVISEKEKLTEFADETRGMSNITDVEEQLRATIRRLEYAGSKMAPLPEKCTYTLAVELRDEAEPPIGHPQPWVPSEPSLQTGEKGESEIIGRDLGGVRSTPVRLVAAGDFVLEAWIEEGKAKFDGD